MSAVIKVFRSEFSGQQFSAGLGPGDGDVGAMWLERWDIEARGGMGEAHMTADLNKAHRFPSKLHAMQAYREQSKTAPIRSDGKPNRPLTAFTIEIIEVP